MLLPIGTDVQHKRHPTVTYALIGINLLVFATQWAVDRGGGIQATNEVTQWVSEFLHSGHLSGTQFHWISLLSYQFIHGSWWHILGNMIFLLPFGKAVEDRMGHVGFALFYLFCGALGGGLHALLSNSPVIGASGSVCAVTAAFVVLAPKTKIHVLLIFFIIGIYKIPSLLFVLFFVLFDTCSLLANILSGSDGSTAWLAHFGGYASGFAITYALLATGFIGSSEYDLAYMLRQSRRRKAYKKSIPKTSSSKKENITHALTVASISQSVASGNTKSAANQLIKFLAHSSTIQLDAMTLRNIGNALLQEKRPQDGVRVFELYLSQHSNADDCCEIALLMAAKYTRELDNPERAKELLQDYAPLMDAKHKNLVASLSDELHL